MRGWVGYYHLANMKRFLLVTDEWLRRRIRMCIWKAWKKVKTRMANLIRCGINIYQAYEWGNTRKGYWRIADSYILHRAITNDSLCRAGYATLMGEYLEWRQNRNRRMRNRMYGGVRGRKTKVGRKLLRFPPIRFVRFIFVKKTTAMSCFVISLPYLCQRIEDVRQKCLVERKNKRNPQDFLRKAWRNGKSSLT